MSHPRRTFIKAGIGSLATLTAATLAPKARGVERDETAREADCLDYGMSFICNAAPFNAVRFWIESRTAVVDTKAGTSTTFYQCGSCKSEHTFAERDLFTEDNYDFLPILGDGEWLIFRRPAALSEDYRRVQSTDDVWGDPVLKLRHASHVTELLTWEQVRDVTTAGTPIVAHTELTNPELGLSARIEYPIKTMNVDINHQIYQVDTGPIVLADLSRRHESAIDSLSLAFVAFNAPDFADFVTEQPTPITADGKEVAEVHHYSGPTSLPARNRLFAAEPYRPE